tara:strand:+ start:2218 stop:2421 length:204 start_codon:yes stop_codon:yes gene_type:complete
MVGITRDEMITRILKGAPYTFMSTYELIGVLSDKKYAYIPTAREMPFILKRIGMVQVETMEGKKWRF